MFSNKKNFVLLKKVGHSRPFFIYFRLFNTIDRKQVNKGLIQIFRQLGVEPGVALTISALEVVAQTTELFFHSKYLANVSQEIKVSREKSCSTFA